MCLKNSALKQYNTFTKAEGQWSRIETAEENDDNTATGQKAARISNKIASQFIIYKAVGHVPAGFNQREIP